MFILELLFGIYILLYLNYYQLQHILHQQVEQNLYSTIFKLLLTDNQTNNNLVKYLYSTIFKLLHFIFNSIISFFFIYILLYLNYYIFYYFPCFLINNIYILLYLNYYTTRKYVEIAEITFIFYYI